VHGDLASSNVLLTRRGARGACGVLGVGRLRAKARPTQRAGPCMQRIAGLRLGCHAWARHLCTGRAPRGVPSCAQATLHGRSTCCGAEHAGSVPGRFLHDALPRRAYAVRIEAHVAAPMCPSTVPRALSACRQHSVCEALQPLPDDAPTAGARPGPRGARANALTARLCSGGGLRVLAESRPCERYHRAMAARRARLPGARGAGALRAQPGGRLLRFWRAAVGDAGGAGAP